MLLDIRENCVGGLPVQASFSNGMIRLHNSAGFEFVNDHSDFSIGTDSQPFWDLLDRHGHSQYDLCKFVLLTKRDCLSLCSITVIAQKIDVAAVFLFPVSLQMLVYQLDQTGQLVIECPSKDDDDDTGEVSVIRGFLPNRIAAGGTAAFDA